MDELELRYTTKDIASRIGVEAVTIRKYAMSLEKAGYMIQRDASNNRLYSATDVTAFEYMQVVRSQTSITIEEAAVLISTRNNTATTTAPSIVYNEGDALSNRYDVLLAKMEQLLAIQQAAPSLQLRNDRVNERITERRIERMLEREAIDAWTKLDASERMIKSGLFRKVEDVNKRDTFVRDYVDERYEDRLRDAYGIND